MAALSNQEQIVPPRLQETDFIRWGQVSTMNEDTTYQNGKLNIPVSVFRKGESEPHIYPVDAYIRIFSNNTIMLISKHPLP
jgi:hypothetical protein